MTEGCNSWLIPFESFARSRGRVRNFLDSRFSILLGLGFRCMLFCPRRKRKKNHRTEAANV